MKTRLAISCCGRKREALRSSSGTNAPYAPLPAHAQSRIPARFRYVGETGLTIHGPVSGRTYRFDAPGVELDVDGRDAYGFDTVPVLERVRS